MVPSLPGARHSHPVPGAKVLLHNRAGRNEVSAIKVIVPRQQTTVIDRAIQIFGAMGLTPDTPLAFLWTWGRALRFIDGPDEVHIRSVARREIKRAGENLGASAAYLTPPEDLAAE